MTRVPRIRSALLLALLGLLWLPSVAMAHAELVESDPPDGGTIASPYTLVARYDEPLGTNRSRIVVRDAAGNEVARGGISEDDPQVMTVELPALPDGDYVAFWTAVTPNDGGVVRGSLEFTIAPPPSPSPSPSPTPSVPPTGSPTVGPASPSPAASPGPTSSATLGPAPPPNGGSAPTGGTTDLLIALAVAGALVAGLVFFLWRRRSA